jgi:hypothetical protein
MWTRNASPAPSAGIVDESLNVEQVAALRTQAVEKMVAAIAMHDFFSARQYSQEEERLRARLKQKNEEMQIATMHPA